MVHHDQLYSIKLKQGQHGSTKINQGQINHKETIKFFEDLLYIHHALFEWSETQNVENPICVRQHVVKIYKTYITVTLAR